MLGLAKDERFALVCPYIPYDAGTGLCLERFSSMSDWLIESRVPSSTSESDGRARARPPRARREKIEVVLGRSGIDPKRYILLPPAPAHTYALMPDLRLRVVFSSRQWALRSPCTASGVPGRYLLWPPLALR